MRIEASAIKKHDLKMLEKTREEGEKNKALAIAKNLVGKMPMNKICLITGLDPADITLL